MNDKSTFIAIRGAMGVGKSFMMTKYIRKILDRDPKAHLFINSFRVSLADMYKNNYSDLEF